MQERRRQRKAADQSGHDRCLDILLELRSEMEEMFFSDATGERGHSLADTCQRMLYAMDTLVRNHERTVDWSAARRREAYDAVRVMDARRERQREQIDLQEECRPFDWTIIGDMLPGHQSLIEALAKGTERGAHAADTVVEPKHLRSPPLEPQGP